MYTTRFTAEHRGLIEQTEDEPSLFAVIEAWLERTPFLTLADYDFWRETAAVERSVAADRLVIEEDRGFDDTERPAPAGGVRRLDGSLRRRLRRRGLRRARSRLPPAPVAPGVRGALLINLYRDEPVLQLPSACWRR